MLNASQNILSFFGPKRLSKYGGDITFAVALKLPEPFSNPKTRHAVELLS